MLVVLMGEKMENVWGNPLDNQLDRELVRKLVLERGEMMVSLLDILMV